MTPRPVPLRLLQPIPFQPKWDADRTLNENITRATGFAIENEMKMRQVTRRVRFRTSASRVST
jgi:hypothetical protein